MRSTTSFTYAVACTGICIVPEFSGECGTTMNSKPNPFDAESFPLTVNMALTAQNGGSYGSRVQFNIKEEEEGAEELLFPADGVM